MPTCVLSVRTSVLVPTGIMRTELHVRPSAAVVPHMHACVCVGEKRRSFVAVCSYACHLFGHCHALSSFSCDACMQAIIFQLLLWSIGRGSVFNLETKIQFVASLFSGSPISFLEALSSLVSRSCNAAPPPPAVGLCQTLLWTSQGLKYYIPSRSGCMHVVTSSPVD
jgi:hypothetical protein